MWTLEREAGPETGPADHGFPRAAIHSCYRFAIAASRCIDDSNAFATSKFCIKAETRAIFRSSAWLYAFSVSSSDTGGADQNQCDRIDTILRITEKDSDQKHERANQDDERCPRVRPDLIWP
jgi:hypothetical protein